MSGISSSFEEAAEIPQLKLLQDLLTAIEKDDHAAFDAVMAKKPDVNGLEGAPLIMAASLNNYLFLNKLVTVGADIPYATSRVKGERAKIEYEEHSTVHGTRKIFKKPEEKNNYDMLTQLITRLEKYQALYVSDISKINAVVLQQQTLEEMQKLRAVIEETMGPRKIVKTPGIVKE